mmetsp:Transcript_9286/g.17767  ORF Transcript_9286/g.17767 Transcript_9286/m.17767 type:complete len:97 (+) Transcript_9286:448-738(+)
MGDVRVAGLEFLKDLVETWRLVLVQIAFGSLRGEGFIVFHVGCRPVMSNTHIHTHTPTPACTRTHAHTHTHTRTSTHTDTNELNKREKRGKGVAVG